jgi:hypothetical protein
MSNLIRSRILALSIALLTMLALPARLAADPADITAAARSVVRVALVWMDRTGAGLVGHGSGIVVAPNLVLTNAHVIAPMADDRTIRALVVPAQGQRGWGAKVVAYSPRNDLALLRIDGGNLPVATLSSTGAGDGAPVFAVGYPGNVDLAQGLDAVDMITPTAPVKTQGTISAGRSSKSFATVLHTAPIGAGNSGGPLMDACGRVIGINSFGTVSDGADAEFFFAVALPEVLRFLRNNQITPHLSQLPCQSMDEFARAQAALAAGDKARTDDAARSAAEARKAADSKATRTAELQVLAERENGIALAGVALLLALIAGGVAVAQPNPRRRKAAAIASAVLVAGALYAWFARPGIEAIDSRAAELAAAALPAAAAGPETGTAATTKTGPLRCVLDPARSRVTVSDIADVPLDWSADGCVNARAQYGLGADGWSRILVPNGEDTITVARFDPATATYTTERFLLDSETMARARAARRQYEPPQCGMGTTGARQLGDSQAAIAALLPPQANERLVYNCDPAETTGKPAIPARTGG